jgi:hypothetical protein
VIVTEFAEVTAWVGIEKVATVAPCGTVIVTGTLAAAEFELERETTTPPTPAADVRLTVPVAVWPPGIAVGDTERLPRAAGAGLMVRLAVTFKPR